MAVVKNLMVRSGADFSALYREMNKAQKRLSTFQKGINKAMKIIGITLGSLAVGKLVKDSISAAMNVENSMLQIQRTMGDSANAFNHWAQTQAKAYGMAREEAFKYGATYSNLISSFTKDTQETARYTTELLKASAVVASATGRTMEDTMERIRSGLLGNTEAIEDLGIHVNVAMLESTEAFRQFARGRSWQQLSFQEQQQIRLLSILEQANIKYGDSLAGTTQTRQLMFLATLKNIRLNLGQAFLPIYNTILPLLTALASKIEYVTGILAQFMQALFGTKQAQQQVKVTQAQAGAMKELGDATEKAGKKAKGAVASFDEIHQIQMGEAGAGVAAGGADVAAESLFGDIDEGAGGVMDQASEKAREMAAKVRAAFDSLISVLQTVGDVLKWLWNNVMVPAGKFIASVFVAAWEAVSDAAKWLWQNILVPFGDFLKWLWNSVLVPVGRILIDVLAVAFRNVAEIAKILWENVLVPLGSFLGTIFVEAVKAVIDIFVYWWGNVLLPFGEFIGGIFRPVIEGLISVFEFLWQNVLKPLAEFMSGVFIVTFETVTGSIKEIINGLKTTFSGLINFITGIFTRDWERAWSGVKDVFRGILDAIKGIFKNTINGIIGFINKFIEAWNKIELKVPEVNIPLVGTVGGWSVRVPQIDPITPLAKGGLVTDPTLALLGEAGPEAVIPLKNSGFVDELASAVGTAVLNALQFAQTGNQQGDIVIQIDGTTLARVLNPYSQKEISRIGPAKIITA